MVNKKFIMSTLIIVITIVSASTTSACTIFTVTQDDKAYFANNEDYYNPNTIMTIRPASFNSFGAIFFGFDDYITQGGINSQGLCFDLNAVPTINLTNQEGRIMTHKWVITSIMESCSNVSEAIEFAMRYNWFYQHETMNYQMHFADASGDAVVISPGFDGDINITRKTPGNGYLVSTNYNLSHGNHSNWCWRYDTAVTMLDTVIEEKEISIEFCRDILDSVHREGPTLNTLYSNIFDLSQKVIYLYYFSQFDEEVVTINVTEELISTSVIRYIPIKSLFSEEVVNKATSINFLYKFKNDLIILLGNFVLIIDFIGLGVIFTLNFIKRRRNK